MLGFLTFALLRWSRRPSGSARAQLLGAIFALIVVLAHIAEAFDVWPSTGWGKPHTVGHRTDLISEVPSVIFLSVAAILALSRVLAPHKRRTDNDPAEVQGGPQLESMTDGARHSYSAAR